MKAQISIDRIDHEKKRVRKMSNAIRDIQTILLCKVNSYQTRTGGIEYTEQYKKLYTGPKANTFRKFITYGNFDAVCIYKTTEKLDGNWLKYVEKDQKDILGNTAQDICYHPVHVISHSADDSFWTNSSRFPACIVTLVYGVMNHGEGANKSYDQYLKQFLQNFAPQIDQSRVSYAVYQAINICDAVIIWTTNDINYALTLSANITRQGKARKTYSLLGLEFIDFDDLQKSEEHLCSNLCDGYFDVRLLGSIRDHKLASEYFLSENPKMQEIWINGTGYKIEPICVFGNEDFDVRITHLSKTQLVSFVTKMLRDSKQISEACWDIHTECILPGNYTAPSVRLPTFSHELDIYLDEYTNNIYPTLKKDPIAFPWASAYLELLATHVNLDHHPILNAPGSIFLNFVKIANYYFRQGKDRNAPEYKILLKSKDKILRVIRNWSQLTAQLTRSDDLVFHGIGRVPAIYESLPESILEFYHAFLMDIIKVIREEDIGLENPEYSGEYQFDFLLIPEQSQRPRIGKMFDLTDYHQSLINDYKSKNEKICKEGCKKCIAENANTFNACKLRFFWPIKQVYLAEFQTGLLYDPPGFLFPMVHECFHCFGDAFRMRVTRTEYLARILANEIQYELQLDKVWYKEFGRVLTEKLIIPNPVGLNSYRSTEELLTILNGLFVSSEFDSIRREIGNPSFLQGEEIRNAWLRLNNHSKGVSTENHWKAIIDKWISYFYECFADIMALLLLGAEHNNILYVYYRTLNIDWESTKEAENDKVNETDSAQSWKFVQRISLVAGAFFYDRDKKERHEYKRRDLQDNVIFKKLRLFQLDNPSNENSFVWKNRYNIAYVIRSLFLYDAERNDALTHPDHPVMLAYILDYLFDVKELFFERFEAQLSNVESPLSIMRGNYKKYFQKGELFTEEFNKLLFSKNPKIVIQE